MSISLRMAVPMRLAANDETDARRPPHPRQEEGGREVMTDGERVRYSATQRSVARSYSTISPGVKKRAISRWADSGPSEPWMTL